MSILSTPPGSTEAEDSGLESARAQRTLGGGEPATTLSRDTHSGAAAVCPDKSAMFSQSLLCDCENFADGLSAALLPPPHLHCSMTLPPVEVVTPGPGWSCSLGGCRGSTSSTPLDRARDPHQDSAVHTYRPATAVRCLMIVRHVVCM